MKLKDHPKTIKITQTIPNNTVLILTKINNKCFGIARKVDKKQWRIQIEAMRLSIIQKLEEEL